MQDAVARFFDIPIFVLLGVLLPWQGWAELGWHGVAFAAAILLFRRLPAWFVIGRLLPSVSTPRETAFNGWFGPIGIAARDTPPSSSTKPPSSTATGYGTS